MFAFVARNADPIKVLLIEDSLGDAMLVKEALEESPAQFEVTHAERLAAALGHLAKTDFAAVVLDLNLPDSKGLDTILKTHQAAPGVAIVVLTGVNDEDVSLKAMECGAQDYLVKDLMEGDLLVHSICHAIERHHARRAEAASITADQEAKMLNA